MKKGLTCLENRCDSDVKPIIFVVILLMPRFEWTTEAEGIQTFQNIPLTFKKKPIPAMVLLFMSR